jgi:hypothetical protein
MEQVTAIPLVQHEAGPKTSFTLQQAKEDLRSLIRDEEANAWEIGNLLNRIEKSGLVQTEGYGQTKSWVDAEVPEAQGKTTTLYRYAYLASHYTKEQVRLWGISRLEYLMAHDQETVGHVVAEDPGEREIELVQQGGSKLTKKFRECTANELRFSNQRRKSTKGQPKSAAPAAAPDAESPPTHSPMQALAMLALGIVIPPLAQLLPSPIDRWVALVGCALFFGGVALLFHHARHTWKRFLVAVKEGKGIAFIKETLTNVHHGTRKLASAIRSNVRSDSPTHSEQSPPPTEKKAA